MKRTISIIENNLRPRTRIFAAPRIDTTIPYRETWTSLSSVLRSILSKFKTSLRHNRHPGFTVVSVRRRICGRTANGECPRACGRRVRVRVASHRIINWNLQAPNANGVYSYEGLPPNFSLWQNMAAGAFAGIAVC